MITDLFGVKLIQYSGIKERRIDLSGNGEFNLCRLKDYEGMTAVEVAKHLLDETMRTGGGKPGDYTFWANAEVYAAIQQGDAVEATPVPDFMAAPEPEPEEISFF